MCEWTTHAVGGGLLWLSGTAVAAHWFGVDVGAAAVLVGTPIAMGAGQLPDTDHPNSGIAHALGPVSQVICRGVSKVFKHRKETHYAVAVPVWAGLAAALARVRLDLLEAPARWVGSGLAGLAGRPDTPDAGGQSLTDLQGLVSWGHGFVVDHADWQLGLFAVVALLAAWGLRALSSDLDRSLDGAGEVAVGIGIAAAAFVWVPLGWWVPAAVGVGVLSHDLTDLLTKGKIRFLWPLPWEISLGWFTTGHPLERVVVGPVLLVVATVLLWVQAVQPLGEQVHLAFAGLVS
jgi:membrane-bound metal-dependent hydrolase YbcI (DUF457 family)